MVPEELIGNLGDVHLYSNHIEQAKEQVRREPFELPKINIIEKNWFIHEKVKESLDDRTVSEKIEGMHIENFELLNYKYHPPIKAKLSN
jgi:thymidylate synthase